MNFPGNAPAKDFWSVVLHDPQACSELQTSQPYPSKNRMQTVPGKGWFTIFRVYGPLEPWFEKTWRPGEIEVVE